MRLQVADFLAVRESGAETRQRRMGLAAYRGSRRVMLGPFMRLQFEDSTTVRHQIFEMIRVDRLLEADDVQREIDTYAHLLPGDRDWRATLFIELPDAHERQRELPILSEAAHHVYVEIAGQPRIVASANDDLPDRHLSRPSAVHFLRFDFSASACAALRRGARVTLGCAHPGYALAVAMSELLTQQLAVTLHGSVRLPDAEGTAAMFLEAAMVPPGASVGPARSCVVQPPLEEEPV